MRQTDKELLSGLHVGPKSITRFWGQFQYHPNRSTIQSMDQEGKLVVATTKTICVNSARMMLDGLCDGLSRHKTETD